MIDRSAYFGLFGALTDLLEENRELMLMSSGPTHDYIAALTRWEATRTTYDIDGLSLEKLRELRELALLALSAMGDYFRAATLHIESAYRSNPGELAANRDSLVRFSQGMPHFLPLGLFVDELSGILAARETSV
ncbi:MAG: hypothetical protein U0136_13100 [Bdellovibrionota bacterium]